MPHASIYRRRATLSLLALFLAGCSTSNRPTLPATEPAAESAADPTIWDGVYSAKQAQRGEQAAWGNCYSCHSIHEWSDEAFLRAPSPWRLGDMFSTIRRSMPYDSPGSLPDSTYVDILAYMLSLQDAPPGPRELPQGIGELDNIMITPPPY